MSAVRLYIDEDASEHAVVQALRARGVDLVTAVEAGMLGEDDAAQLAHAAADHRALYTFNVRDFARLHREHIEAGEQHAGIIVIPDQRCSIGEKVRRVADPVSRMTAEQLRSRIEFL